MTERRWRTWEPGERNRNHNETRNPDLEITPNNTTRPNEPGDTLAILNEPQNVGLVVHQATDNDAIQIKTGRKWYKRLWYLLSNWWIYLFKGERRW